MFSHNGLERRHPCLQDAKASKRNVSIPNITPQAAALQARVPAFSPSNYPPTQFVIFAVGRTKAERPRRHENCRPLPVGKAINSRSLDRNYST